MKYYDVMFHTIMLVRQGKAHVTRVGLGSDGHLFLDLMDFRLRPEDLRETEEYPSDCPLVLANSRDGRTYVNARALAEILATPEARANMKASIEWMLVKLKEQIALRHENVRNN